MGIAAALGPHRELSSGAAVANRPTVSRKKWAAPRAVLAQPSRSRDIKHVAGAGGDGQKRVITTLAGIAVVAFPSLASP